MTGSGMPSVLEVNVRAGTTYTSAESSGVTVVVAAACMSLLSSVILLGYLAGATWKQRSAPSQHIFVRTHAAGYFTSLIVADVIQSVGSIMSTKWIIAGRVSAGSFCSAQATTIGAIKNAGNLAVSLWALMLALHAFCVLFLRMQPKDWVLYVTLIGVWFLVGFLVVIGPAIIQRTGQESYFGVSGFWCWISNSYPAPRILLEYSWMFTSGGLSFILYTLTLLHLRGNIELEGKKIKFTKVNSSEAWRYQVTRSSSDVQMIGVMTGVIWFPILFTALILPIAICRFVAWSGGSVPFEATIFADAVFSWNGAFDVMLFFSTRSLFPRDTIFWLSRPKISIEVKEQGIQPYSVQDLESMNDFNKMYRSQAESEMVALDHSPPLTRIGSPDSAEKMLPPLPIVSEDYESLRREAYRMAPESQYSQDSKTNMEWERVDLDHTAPDFLAAEQGVGSPSLPNIRVSRFTISSYLHDDTPAASPSDHRDQHEPSALAARMPTKTSSC